MPKVMALKVKILTVSLNTCHFISFKPTIYAIGHNSNMIMLQVMSQLIQKMYNNIMLHETITF